MHTIDLSQPKTALNHFIAKRIDDFRLQWLYENHLTYLRNLSACVVIYIEQSYLEEEDEELDNTILQLVLHYEDKTFLQVNIHVIQGFWEVFLEGSYGLMQNDTPYGEGLLIDDYCQTPEISNLQENIRALLVSGKDGTEYEFFELLEQLELFR